MIRPLDFRKLESRLQNIRNLSQKNGFERSDCIYEVELDNLSSELLGYKNYIYTIKEISSWIILECNSDYYFRSIVDKSMTITGRAYCFSSWSEAFRFKLEFVGRPQ